MLPETPPDLQEFHPQAWLAAIIDSSDDAIISKNLQGVILSWNKAAVRVFGYAPEEAVGRPITMLLPEDRIGEEAMILGRIRAGQRVDHFETIRRRKDGALIDVSVTISPIKNSNGIVVGASKIARDITEQKRTERIAREATGQLERANERLKEMDRLKSEFLANMSHELRTPLNSIIGFTGILRQQIPGPLNEEQQKQLGMVSNSARHLLHLIEEILDLSRIEAGRVDTNLERLDLAPLAREATRSLEPVAAQKGLSLVCTIPGQLHVRSDRKILLQVMLNLLSNAVKFTTAGEVRLTVTTSDHTAVVAVADTGIGIRAEQMKLLFEAFRQLEPSSRRQYEGTGLGLHISQRLLELLGSRITVESEYGRGSIFSFSVPLENT